MASVDERNKAYNHELCFHGFARVELPVLKFGTSTDSGSHRPVSERNVSRLVRIFKTEGCHRSDPNNFIKAVVDANVLLRLSESQQQGTISKEQPEHWSARPLLPVSSVECLDGLHRVKAADQFLDNNDKWWVVALYSEGKSMAYEVHTNCL